MGYKSTIRSFSATSKRINHTLQVQANQRQRELQKQQRQLQVIQDKISKKSVIVDQKRNKPLELLKEMYASGKIDKKKFELLEQRDTEITVDLIVFGKGAGQKIAERYVTGNITKSEFNELESELEKEKTMIMTSLQAQIDKLNSFTEKARANTNENICSNCGKEKKFFSPLRKEQGMVLCGACQKTLQQLCNYPGYSGTYYDVRPTQLAIDTKNNINMSIKPAFMLNY
jgi:uncharacterized membrane protein